MDLDGVRWRKSSWSSGSAEDTNCVEVALVDTSIWRKSSWSSGQDEENSNCVEVAMIGSASPALSPDAAYAMFAAIRDSKNPGPALLLPHTAWSGLVYRLFG